MTDITAAQPRSAVRADSNPSSRDGGVAPGGDGNSAIQARRNGFQRDPARIDPHPDRTEKVRLALAAANTSPGVWQSTYCLGHEDEHPSGSVMVGVNGKLALKCHSQGCLPKDIKATFKERGLLPGRARLIASYRYEYEDGSHAFDVRKYLPKAFSQCAPDGRPTVKGIRRVPYKLPELLAAPAGDWVLVNEGEEATLTAILLGFKATNSPGGAGKFRPEYAQYFVGKKVVWIADNDEPGERHVKSGARILQPVAAEQKILRLPGLPPGGDLRDWVKAGGTADDLRALIAATPPLSEEDLKPSDAVAGDAILDQLSKKYVYARGVHAILRLSDYSLARADQFILDEKNQRIIRASSSGRLQDLCGPEEWLKDPRRPDVEKLVYEPAYPTGRLADGNFNLYRASVEPKAGEGLHLYHRLMSELIPDSERRAWVESWIFYPIQHPGTKLYTTVLLWSRQEGTGKSFLGELVKRMYGTNGYELNNAERLFEPFNPWAVQHQFVLVNEISSGDNRKRINKIKNLVSGEEVEVNLKNKPHYTIRDTINYLLTSNHEDALYMTDASRRFAVFHVSESRLDKDFIKALRAWKFSTAGPELLHYGLTYPILDSFEPFAPAPWTADNAEMVQESTSSLEDKCLQVVRTDKARPDEEGAWVFGHRDLWTSEDIVREFNENSGERVNRVSVGRAMSRAGAVRLGVIKIHGKPERILAIRDFERYQQIARENPAKIAALYAAERLTKFTNLTSEESRLLA